MQRHEQLDGAAGDPLPYAVSSAALGAGDQRGVVDDAVEYFPARLVWDDRDVCAPLVRLRPALWVVGSHFWRASLAVVNAGQVVKVAVLNEGEAISEYRLA